MNNITLLLEKRLANNDDFLYLTASVKDNTLNLGDLYIQAKTGDKTSEDIFFQKLSGRFRLFIRQKIRNREDADEVLQKALMTIAEKYRTVDITLSFEAWAHKILSNKILDHYRSQGRRNDKIVVLSESNHSSVPFNPDPLMEKKLLDCLKKVRSANIRFGRILVLHYQGFSVAESCRKLKINPSGLYKALWNARTLLRTCLEKGELK